MKISVREAGETFEVKSHVIREKYDPDRGEVATHFEAIIQDMRKSRSSLLVCHFKYEKEDGQLLGLDKEALYCSDDLDERYIEVALDIPDGTESLSVNLREGKHSSFVDRHEGLVIGGVVITVAVVLIFAAKGLFGWQ